MEVERNRAAARCGDEGLTLDSVCVLLHRNVRAFLKLKWRMVKKYSSANRSSGGA